MQTELVLALGVASLTLLVGLALRTAKPSSHLEPDRPPEVPYLLPWLGHAVEFGFLPDRFLQRCRRKYGDTFKTVLAGRKIIFVTDPSLMSVLFRNSRDFVLGPLRSDVNHAAFGISRDAAGHAVLDDEVYKPAFRQWLRTTMEPTTSVFARVLQRELCHRPSGAASLHELVLKTFYTCTAASLFGEGFPLDTFADYTVFDQGFTLLSAQLPRFVGTRYHTARQAVLSKICDFIGRNSVGYAVSETSVLLDGVTAAMNQADFVSEDVGGHVLSLFWGFQANTSWTLFWLLAFIVRDPEYLRRVREEVDSFVDKYHGGSLDTLIKADPVSLEYPNLPLIESGIRETIRMHSSLLIARQCVRDSVLRAQGTGRILRVHEGEIVFATPRGTHMDPAIYDHPEEFRLDRFLDCDGVSIRQFSIDGKPSANSWLGWGGGDHVCKGRHIALYEIKLFIVTVIRTFNISPVAIVNATTGKKKLNATLPAVDHSTITVFHSADDMILDLQPRSQSDALNDTRMSSGNNASSASP